MAELDTPLPEYADTRTVRNLFALFDKWRGEAIVPSRDTLKLRDISHHMDSVFLFDVISETEIIIRYFGSLFMDYYGVDHTGRNFLEVTDESVRELRAKRMVAVVEQPCAAIWTTRATSFGVMQHFSVGVSFPLAVKAGQPPTQILQVCLPLQGMEHPSFRKAKEDVKINLADRYKFIDIGAGVGASDFEAEQIAR